MTRRALIALGSLACCLGVAASPGRAEVVPTYTDAVILATNSVHLMQNSQVLSGDVTVTQASPGPVLSSGAELAMAQNASVALSASLRADSIDLKQHAVVGSRVYCNDLTDATGEASCAAQSLPVLASLPGFLDAQLAGGEPPISVPQNGSATLAAGAYGVIQANQKSTLTFTGGTYHIAGLSLAQRSQMLFLAPTILRIAGRTSIAQNSYVGPAPGSSFGASGVVFYVAGANGGDGSLNASPKSVEIAQKNQVFANIFAPNGTLFVRQNSDLVGAFIARDIQIGQNSTVAWDTAFTDQAPTADGQGLDTDGDNSLLITLTGSDPEGEALTFSIVTPPTQGTLSPLVAAPPDAATLTYTPTACAGSGSSAVCPTDSFVFRVADPSGAFDEATVVINAVEGTEPEPDEIVANGGSVEILEATVAEIQLAAFAPSSIGDLVFTLLDEPDHGDLGPIVPETGSPVRSATVVFTPDDYTGPDSLEFNACDAADLGNCDAAVIQIFINSFTPPPPPVAFGQSVETGLETDLTINLAGAGSQTSPPDDEGRPLLSAARSGRGARRGSVSGSAALRFGIRNGAGSASGPRRQQAGVPEVDQEQPSIDGSAGTLVIGGGSEQKLAQTLTHGVSGELTEVRLPIACNPDAEIILDLQGVDGGPAGAIVSTTVFDGADLPFPVPSSLRSLPLETPLQVTSGDSLALVVSTAQVDAIGDADSTTAVPVSPDLFAATAESDSSDLHLEVRFAAGTLDPATTRATVFLDTDEDAGTGCDPSESPPCSGPSNDTVGWEFRVDIPTAAAPGTSGLALLRRNQVVGGTTFVANVAYLTNGDRYALSIPLSLLDGDDGNTTFRVQTTVFSTTGNASDVTPPLDYLPDLGAPPGSGNAVCVMAQGPTGDPYAAGSAYYDARPNTKFGWVPFGGPRDDLPFQTVVAPAGPDLVIASFTHAPAAPDTEGVIEVTAVVENVGGEAAGASTLCIDIGGETCDAPTSEMLFPIPALAPSQTAQATRALQLPAQAYTNEAEADVANDVAEADENNNTAIDGFTVTQASEPPLLSYVVTSLPTNGTLTTALGGPITVIPATIIGSLVIYEPAPGFAGTDLFSYQVFDGFQLSNVAIIDVLVFEVGCLSCAEVEIDLTGNGQGDVSSSPRPENDLFVCGVDCTMEFSPGIAVTLQARPTDSFSIFNGWGGDCSGSSPIITITVGAGGTTRSCEARFDSTD
jgi:CARDB/Bacterial Ig domain